MPSLAEIKIGSEIHLNLAHRANGQDSHCYIDLDRWTSVIRPDALIVAQTHEPVQNAAHLATGLAVGPIADIVVVVVVD